MLGLALGAEIALRKKQKAYKKREYNKYIAIYRQTNAQYNLGIPDSVLHNAADRYADLNAKRAYPTISGVVSAMFNKKNIWKTITNILGAIVGIALSIFPPTAVAGWVMVTGVVSSIIGGVTALTLQVLEIKSAQMLEFRSKQITSLSSGTQLQKEHLKAMNQQITDLLIYNPYAMFPEGELYKQDRAGSIGYQAGLEAPNPMRAINGVHSTNTLAKQITNTAHTNLAGNKDYNPTPLPFPTQNFTENAKIVKEGIMADVKTHTTQIQKGFSILAENYFCFDDESTFKYHFDRNIRERVNPRILRFNCYSFIEQNKYYSKGERLPRFYHQLLPSQIKYKGLPKFDDAPLVFVSSIKYDMGELALKVRDTTAYPLGGSYLVDCADFVVLGQIITNFKTKECFLARYEIYNEYLRYWAFYHHEIDYYKPKAQAFFNRELRMLFLLGTSGEVLRSIYALKAEVSSILKGNAPSTKEIPVVEGEWYAILVAKVKKDKINNDLVSGNHLRDCDNFETIDTQNNTTALSQGGARGLELRSRSPYPPLTPQTPDNALQGLRFTRFDLTQNHSMILQSENPQETQETTSSGGIFEIESGLLNQQAQHKGEVFANDFKGCEALSAETSLKGLSTNEKQISLKSTAKTSQKQTTTDKITLQELRDLKQSTLDLYNPPKIPLWDYYDIEIMSVTSNAKAVPSVAENAKKKFDIKGDDFVLFGINEKMLEAYDFELEKTPEQWQEANTLLYSFVTYTAEKQKE